MVRNLVVYLTIPYTLLLKLCVRTHAELFISVAELDILLDTYARIIDDLEIYIHKEEKRLATIKRHLDIYKKEHEKAMVDIPNYLGNPINAFTLIKRLTIDLDHLNDSIQIGTEYINNLTLKHVDAKYPSVNDVLGAAQGLTRLQKTYGLNLKDLSEGKLMGVAYSKPMSSGDCYELSRALLVESDYKNARDWMFEALRKYNEEETEYYFTVLDILEHISFSYFLSGDAKSALEWTEKLLKLDPKRSRARNNVPHYLNSIAEEEAQLRRQSRGETVTNKRDEKSINDTHYRRYYSLCRGDIDVPIEISSKLTCRYFTENHPFLKLAPIKMETLYLSPDIVLFHDVLSDNEIETLKEMARPKFKRAAAQDPKTGETGPVKYRIAKLAWLDDKESRIVARVSRRVTDMTGLSIYTAEELQVLNYGIGGHYEPHHDFSGNHNSSIYVKNKFGGRIATVLFYMSHVPQGGATVFTEIGLTVFPVKGAAAYWLNLHPSGKGDFATAHAACPVLRGSKWVGTKWLHEEGQELLKPCNLESQGGVIRTIPRPVPKAPTRN